MEGERGGGGGDTQAPYADQLIIDVGYSTLHIHSFFGGGGTHRPICR